MRPSKNIAIVGSGPAGLMAASVLAGFGHRVSVFEYHATLARKLLIAGQSGLNVTHQTDLLSEFYSNKEHFLELFKEFSSDDWLKFIHNLGIETFLGSSRRYFVKGLKARELVSGWLKNLTEQGVEFFYKKELTDFSSQNNQVSLVFNSSEKNIFDAAVLALGGLSWQATNRPIGWPQLFKNKNIKCEPFKPANAGFLVDWSADFLKEVEGQSLKNITLKTADKSIRGELTITKYGLEGTPVYNLTQPQTIFLDLKPDLTHDQILKKLSGHTKNLSLLRLAKKYLNCSPAVLALLYYHADLVVKKDPKTFVDLIKHFPIVLKAQQGIEKAISSAGGVSLSELDKNLMLKKYPNIFLAGEMIDWSAPTGGFLIQGCVSQGFYVANQINQSFASLRAQAKQSSAP